MRFRTARTWLTFLASVFVGAPALAQPAPVESATNGRDTGTTEVAQAGPGPSPAASAAATSAPAPTVAQATTPPGQLPAPGTAPPPPEPNDHEVVVGKIGVSWLGVSNVPIATGAPSGTGTDPSITLGEPATVSAPAIGVRYWFNDTFGIEGGIGFSVSTGEIDTTTSAADKQTVFAFLLHAGAPLSLYSSNHISLQITPEMSFGHARSEVESTLQFDPPPNATLTGMRFDVGARAGAELHWGFLGVPELSLEGSVGLFFTYQETRASVDDVDAGETNLLFGTAQYQSPWDIFTQHVRARYYF